MGGQLLAGNANGWFGAGGNIASGDCCAGWNADTTRYIAVSYDNGSDSNQGFSDVSMAAAGGVALKTLTALRALVPSIGAGRRLVIAIETRAGGAVYLKPDGVTQDDLILEGIVGYQKFLLRGTVTDTTAGSVAFANSAADKLMAGFIRGTGTNANGYNVSVLNSDRDFTIQLAGGGAVALPTTMALSGWRIRFASNTPTVALRNQTRMLSEMSAVNRLLTDEDTSTSPATGNAGDVFFIEMPGVAVKGIVTDIRNAGKEAFNLVFLNYTDLNSYIGTTSLVGIRQTDAAGLPVISGAGDMLEMCGIQVDGTSLEFGGQDVVTNSGEYSDENGTTIRVGCGTKTAGLAFVYQDPVIKFAWNSSSIASSSLFLMNVQTISVGKGSMIPELNTECCGMGSAKDVSNSVIGLFGASTTQKYPVNYSASSHAQRYKNSQIFIGYIESRNAGAVSCIAFSGICSAEIRGAFGSTGNTGYGIDTLSALGSKIFIDTTITTVTGTAGDIQLDGSLSLSYAQLLAKGTFVDKGLNEVNATTSSNTGIECITQLEALRAEGEYLAEIKDGGCLSDDFVLTPSSTSLGTNWDHQKSVGAFIGPLSGPAYNGGVGYLETGAILGNFADLLSHSILANNLGTQKWYCFVRMKSLSGITNASWAGAGLGNTNRDVIAGILGAGSVVNYFVGFDAARAGALTYLDTGVAISGNFDIVKMWCKGDGKIRAKVNNSAEVSANQATPGTNGSAFVSVQTGTVATDQDMAVDLVLFGYERST